MARDLLEPDTFVWCTAGPHGDETLGEIVDRKRRDIECHGWCLWAYGGPGGPGHPTTQVRRLAREYSAGGRLVVLMPATGEIEPPTQEYHLYRQAREGEPMCLPDGMSKVTGGKGAWALWLTSLRWVDDAWVDTAHYTAPYACGGPKPLPTYRRGGHGRACAARVSQPVGSPDLKQVHLKGELSDPYAVFLGLKPST